MKKIFCILLAVLSACCLFACENGGSGKTDDTSSSDGIHFTFSMDGTKPESMSNIWMCPKALDSGVLIPGWADDLTNEANWPTLLENTSTLKLYIEMIGKMGTVDLRKIADFVNEHHLTVCVEVAGERAANSGVPDDNMGAAAAQAEFMTLFKFIKVGGRVDYITTDHAMASEITGRTSTRPDMTMQDHMQQQMEYYKYMIDKMPGLKVGAIESLGFFWVNTANGQMQCTDYTLDRVDFENYMSELVRIAGENGVKIDHFHIDFGMHDIESDGNYDRVLAVEDYCHSLGVKTGFIAGNAFHKKTFVLTNEEGKRLASESAAERTLQYFEGYMQAGGRSDVLLFQRWQDVPVELGNEETPVSNFGIFKAMLDSELFPKK